MSLNADILAALQRDVAAASEPSITSGAIAVVAQANRIQAAKRRLASLDGPALLKALTHSCAACELGTCEEYLRLKRAATADAGKALGL